MPRKGSGAFSSSTDRSGADESGEHDATESLLSRQNTLTESLEDARDAAVRNANKPGTMLPSITVSTSSPTMLPTSASPDEGWASDTTEILEEGGLWMNPHLRSQSKLSPTTDKDPHQMFVELYDLDWDPVTGQALWQETARWIKYEEDAEGIDHHWGRPHVAFLSFHALHQLKACLKHGLILLDLDVDNFEDACTQMAGAMADKFKMDEQRTSAVLATLQRKHRHVHEARPLGRVPSLARSQSHHKRDPSWSDFKRMNTTPVKPLLLSIIKLRHCHSLAASFFSKFGPGGGNSETKANTARNKSSSNIEEGVSAGKPEGRGMAAVRSFSPPNLATLAEAEDEDFSERRSVLKDSAHRPPRKSHSGSKITWAMGSGDGLDKHGSLPHIDKTDISPGEPGARGVGGRERGASMVSTKTNMSKVSNMSFSIRAGLGQAFSTIRSMNNLTAGAKSDTGMSQQDIDELMKKVPDGCETAQVFVGVLSELTEARFCMVRLKEAVTMPELLDAPIPIRFLFVILGPAIVDVNYHEIGRSIATLMSNPHFHSIAYSAPSSAQIDSAIDDFLDGSIVIPPGEIDSKELLSVEEIKKALRRRKSRTQANRARLDRRRQRRGFHAKAGDANGKAAVNGEGGGKGDGERRKSSSSDASGKKGKRGDPLKRTGKLFGGLIADIRWRAPQYWSDFRDALNFQCFTSVIFMFFAAFAPAITFGGLMGNYTKDQMGITETLIAQCVCGVVWGLTSAQPLMVMSATGPILIFEYSLYGFCKAMGLPFMTIRVWTGVWVLAIAIVTVMFEGSFLVSYVSPFTEDIFAALISIIFVAESIKFIEKTFIKNPVEAIDEYIDDYQGCMNFVNTAHLRDHNVTSPFYNLTAFSNTFNETLEDQRGLCEHTHQPDSGLLTAILLIGTFVIALLLKRVRGSYFFGRTIRRGLGDFGVLIAIVIMGLFDNFVMPKTYLERLHMPANFNYTNPGARGHGLIVTPWLGPHQWHGYLFAAVPALLVYILLFVETEITELLLAKKDKGLKKGTGYHWDLLLVGALCFVCSIFGLPWMCAAAVQSLAHASSLTVMKRHAPGERPGVDYVIEQRVTTIGCSVLVGACAFLGEFLSTLPLATLFGVFLYLGVMNLLPVQLMHRIVLFFIPEKYFPDTPYCQQVSMWRMHLWTLIQVLCLGAVYIVKHFKVTSLGFPFALMLVALFRLFVVPRVFRPSEVEALDGHEEPEEEEDEEGFPYSVF